MFRNLFANVRAKSPLVHNITNYVTVNDCANIVLAAGASPIMADAPEEVREITALSRALCLSLGTPNPRKADAMFLAGSKAAELGLPVVFDPVGVGASAYRQEIAQKLLRDIPLTVLRCNASELQTLSGQSLVSRGVDAGKAPELETLLLPADPAYIYLSSTVAREMIHYHQPLDKYLPKAILPLIRDWTEQR